MQTRWVGVIIAITGGIVLFWSWQSLQEQKRLAYELTVTQTALLRIKEQNVDLNAQLADVQSNLDRLQSQQGQLTAKLDDANAQIAAADEARQQAEEQLLAMQSQEHAWLTEKQWLEQRIAALQEDKDALEQRLSALDASSPSTTSAVQRIVPPTAGEHTSRSGNGGFLFRKGGSSEESAPRVDVRPAPSAIQGDALIAPVEPTN